MTVEIMHLARTGEKYLASAMYEGVLFAADGASQAEADANVKGEIVYQLLKRQRGLANKLDGTL